MLLGIWWGSWSLCGAALSMLVLLIGVRAYRRRRDQHDRTLSRRLLHDLLAWLDDDSHDVSSLRTIAAKRPEFVGHLLFRAAELVQGAERARIVGLARVFGLQERLMDALRHGRAFRRRQAAETLAMFEGDQASAALRAALSDRQEVVRLAAARSLATQGQPVPLAKLVDNPGWLGDSALVQDLLGKLAVHQSVGLADLAGNDAADPRVRALALQALAGAGNYEYLSLLLEMALSRHEVLREASATALGILGHPRGAAVLPSLLRDTNWAVRAAAAEAAARIASPGLAPGLESALEDENWWVRSRAADALGALGDAGHEALSRVARGVLSPARDAAALNLAGKTEPR